MNTNTTVATRGGARPVPAEPIVPPSLPVNAWGITNRIVIVAAIVLAVAEFVQLFTTRPDGLVVLGEGGVGFVPLMLSLFFALIGGSLAGVVASWVVNVMGGYGRNAGRYAIGGLVGGIVSVLLLIMIFSNTAAENSGWVLLIGMPVAGLIGGLWAGISSARRH
ncbi:hypothetical protein ACSBQY_05130 [Micrococcus lylae]|uniref:Uncharacterized protein n=1 Tax=Micrococcus lylae TaxID=1273 RepID=A0A1R4IJ39_9MICC|nr:hypothetical protein [Micrococcus lylae]SJN19735.1 hypothetical protein FM125_02730 [Micrococcus lylae]